MVKKGIIKKEKKKLLLASQEHLLCAIEMKAKFEKTQHDSKWQLCKQQEIVEHLINGCKKIVQIVYLERHNKMPT